MHSLRTSAKHATRRLAFISIPLKDLSESLSYAMRDILMLTVGFVLSLLTNNWIYVFITQRICILDLPIIPFSRYRCIEMHLPYIAQATEGNKDEFIIIPVSLELKPDKKKTG
ncbi:hypothetical protein GH733_002968, partial [Mirounga leonina]